MNKDRVV